MSVYLNISHVYFLQKFPKKKKTSKKFVETRLKGITYIRTNTKSYFKLSYFSIKMRHVEVKKYHATEQLYTLELRHVLRIIYKEQEGTESKERPNKEQGKTLIRSRFWMNRFRRNEFFVLTYSIVNVFS